MSARSMINSAAKSIAADLEAGIVPCSGICPAIVNIIADGNHSATFGEDIFDVNWLLATIFKAWPAYSGGPTYPVPHPKMSPGEAYCCVSGTDKWDAATEYGRARRDLLAFIIEQTEGNE